MYAPLSPDSFDQNKTVNQFFFGLALLIVILQEI